MNAQFLNVFWSVKTGGGAPQLSDLSVPWPKLSSIPSMPLLLLYNISMHTDVECTKQH